MRVAELDQQFDLSYIPFREPLLKLAATLHRTDPGDLDGEDVRQHRRTRRITRAAIGALSTLLILAMVFGGVAVANSIEAANQRDRATTEAAIAASRDLAAQSTGWAGSRRLLLAAQAYHLAPTVEARSALFSAVADPGTAPGSDNSRLLSTMYHEGAVTGAAFSLSGTAFATANGQGEARSWPVAANPTTTTSSATGSLVAFAGEEALAVANGDTVNWTDPGSGDRVGEPAALPQVASALASGADGIYFGTETGTVGVARSDGSIITSDEPNSDRVVFIGTDSDATVVVTADALGRIVVRDGRTLQIQESWLLPERKVTGLSADGTAIVSIGNSADSFDQVNSDLTTTLATVHAVQDGSIIGQLVAAEPRTVVSAGFLGGSAQQIAVIAFDATLRGSSSQSADTSRPYLYRGEVTGSVPVPPQPAIPELEGDISVAFPVSPAVVLTDPSGSGTAVTGSSATVISRTSTEEQTSLLPWLTGPTAPISVAEDTGVLLVSGQDGLGLADLIAPAEPDPNGIVGESQPVTALGIVAESGWLTPDGSHLLVGQGNDIGGEWFDSLLVDLSGTSRASRQPIPEAELGVTPAVSGDGGLIAFAVATLLPSADGTDIAVLDTETGSIATSGTVPDVLCELECLADSATLALSPDGRYLAMRTPGVRIVDGVAEQSSTPQVVLFDTTGDTWTELARLTAATTSVPTFTEAGRLRFHDGVETIYSIDPATPAVEERSFSVAADRWVLDGSGTPVATQACTVTVLDPITGRTLGTATPGDAGQQAGCRPVQARWIEPTRSIMITEDLGRIYTVPADADALLTLACSLAGRNLRAAEWQQFVPAAPYAPTCPELPIPQQTAVTAVPPPTVPGETASDQGDPESSVDDQSVTNAADGAVEEEEQQIPVVVQPGLPTPPQSPVSVPADFAGRQVILDFVTENYVARGLDPAEGIKQVCFVEPITGPEDRCISVIRSSVTDTVLVEYRGDTPFQWILLVNSADAWEPIENYVPSESVGPVPQWVTASG